MLTLKKWKFSKGVLAGLALAAATPMILAACGKDDNSDAPAPAPVSAIPPQNQIPPVDPNTGLPNPNLGQYPGQGVFVPGSNLYAGYQYPIQGCYPMGGYNTCGNLRLIYNYNQWSLYNGGVLVNPAYYSMAPYNGGFYFRWRGGWGW